MRWTGVARLFVCFGLSLHTGPLAAQARLTLGKPDATSAADFERIMAVRELRDGSILLVDRAENALVHLPSVVVPPRRIGRVGSGPLEYRTVGSLWPLAGDSSLLIDEYTGRWLVLQSAALVAQYSESRSANQVIRSRTDGVSADGAIVGVRPTRFRAGVNRTENTAESLAVVRVGMRSERVDTLTVIAGHGGGGVTRIPARDGRPEFLLDFNPLSAAEQVLLHPDGWLSVVRLNPYRVDWRRPDGSWVRGAPLPETVRPVTRAEQCEAIARIFPSTFMACDPSTFAGWPRSVPPVRWRVRTAEPTLWALPQGKLAVARTPSLGDPRRLYDIVDRRGLRVGILTLAEGEVLVGSSARFAYVSLTDEDGLQRLRRYEWPVPVRGPANR